MCSVTRSAVQKVHSTVVWMARLRVVVLAANLVVLLVVWLDLRWDSTRVVLLVGWRGCQLAGLWGRSLAACSDLRSGWTSAEWTAGKMENQLVDRWVCLWAAPRVVSLGYVLAVRSVGSWGSPTDLVWVKSSVVCLVDYSDQPLVGNLAVALGSDSVAWWARLLAVCSAVQRENCSDVGRVDRSGRKMAAQKDLVWVESSVGRWVIC